MKKKDTHPFYQEVLFIDSSTGTKFLIGSTLSSKEKEVFEGKEYPVCRVSISSASHPFFTGSKQLIDSEGRVDKFTKRYKRKQEAISSEQEKQEQEKERQKAQKKKKKK